MKTTPLYEVRDIKDLKDMIRQSAELYSDKAAFLVKKTKGGPYEEISYSKYRDDVDAMGTSLLDLSGQNSRIAILAETRYEWYVTYMAVVNGTGIVVPLDKEQPEQEIISLLDRAKVDTIVYSSAYSNMIASLADRVSTLKHRVCMDTTEKEASALFFSDLLQQGYEKIKEGDRSFIDAEIDPEEMRILLFTSGTTDKSKAVMLCHKNICANLMDMCSMKYIGTEDIFLSVLPLHHTYECTCGFMCPIYRGSTVAVCEGLRYIVKNMQECKVTIILVVPLMLEMFHRAIMKKAKADPKSARKFNFGIGLSRFLMRLGIDNRKKIFKAVHDNFGGHLNMIVCGGASVNPQIMQDMRDMGLPTIQGYGLTECAPILALNRDIEYNNASAGLPLPHCDVKVIDKDADGIGEIIGKGPNVMLGYYEDEEATAASIDEEQYYHTGDLGYIDEDGFVMITGRKKNVIISKNGKNIFPEEIEALLSISDYVSEVLVYAEDSKDGDIIVAAEIRPDMETVEKELGASPSNEAIQLILEREVKEVNNQLPSYKAVRRVIYREKEFDKTTSKKIKRSYKK